MTTTEIVKALKETADKFGVTEGELFNNLVAVDGLGLTTDAPPVHRLWVVLSKALAELTNNSTKYSLEYTDPLEDKVSIVLNDKVTDDYTREYIIWHFDHETCRAITECEF